MHDKQYGFSKGRSTTYDDIRHRKIIYEAWSARCSCVCQCYSTLRKEKYEPNENVHEYQILGENLY